MMRIELKELKVFNKNIRLLTNFMFKEKNLLSKCKEFKPNKKSINKKWQN